MTPLWRGKPEWLPALFLLLIVCTATLALAESEHHLAPEDAEAWTDAIEPQTTLRLAAGRHALAPRSFPPGVRLVGEEGATVVLEPREPLGTGAFLSFEGDAMIENLRIEATGSEGTLVRGDGGALRIERSVLVGGSHGVVQRGGSLDLPDVELNAQAEIGVRWIADGGDARLDGLHFENAPPPTGIHVVARNEETAGTLVVQDIRARDVPGHAFGFLAIVEPQRFASVRLDRLRLGGRSGTGVRLVSRLNESTAREGTLQLADSELEGWETALSAEASGAARLIVEATGTEEAPLILNRNGVAIGLDGTAATLRSEGILLQDNRTGVVLARGARAVVENSVLNRHFDAAVDVGTESSLRLASSRLERNATGVRVHAGAGEVVLGTEEEPGDNRFQVEGTSTWVVDAEEDRLIPAFGNRWFLNRLETFGHVAIGDLTRRVAPPESAEPHHPAVEVEQGDTLAGRRLRWDLYATRATPGYGHSVFRTWEETALRLERAERLELGPGDYPAPPLPPGDIDLRGSGIEQTRVRPHEPLVAPLFFDDGAAALRLADLTFEVPEGSDSVPVVDWGGGVVEWNSVRLANVGSTPAVRFASEGPPIEWRRSEVLLADEPTTAGGPAVALAGRSLRATESRIVSRGGVAALSWEDRSGTHLLSGREFTLEAHDAPTTAAAIRGAVDLDRLVVRTDGATALDLAAGDSPTTATLRRYRLSDFREAGLHVRGDYESVRLVDGTLAASNDREARAAGLVLQADGQLEIDGLQGGRIRPGIDVRRVPERLRLHNAWFDLAPGFNTIAEQEDGIRFAAPSRVEDAPIARPTVTGARISGYDAAIHVVASHDDPTTITLGNFSGPGANLLVRNSVGVRVASPRGSLSITETLSGSGYLENGTALLVEDGRVRVSGARMVQNQAGVVVRGGIADLGGGPLDSPGRNLLWPQAGPFALVNEAPRPLYAVGNAWGDAAALLGTDAAPLRASEEGPIFTVRPTPASRDDPAAASSPR